MISAFFAKQHYCLNSISAKHLDPSGLQLLRFLANHLDPSIEQSFTFEFSTAIIIFLVDKRKVKIHFRTNCLQFVAEISVVWRLINVLFTKRVTRKRSTENFWIKMATLGDASPLSLAILSDGWSLGWSDKQSEPDFFSWKVSNGLENVETDITSEVLTDQRCNFVADDKLASTLDAGKLYMQ